MMGRWSWREVGISLGRHVFKDHIYEARDGKPQNKSQQFSPRIPKILSAAFTMTCGTDEDIE